MFLGPKDDRTRNTQLNILYSFIIKFISIGSGLLLVPLTLRFLTTAEYGIWITLSSILVWVNTFDIGIGNGLRNKLTESFAKSDKQSSSEFVSTAYFTMSFIVLFILSVFLVINKFIDWHKILNIEATLISNISYIVIISFACFCITFILKLISSILLAQQKAAIDSLLVMLGQVLSLLLFLFFSRTDIKDRLFFVAVVYSISPALIYLVFSAIYFRGSNSFLFPKLRHVKIKYTKPLLSLGGQFFIIQISGLVIFSTSSLILVNLFGPETVTTYNIAFRYFNVVLLFFSVILTPIWSATADAYVKDDIEWIRKSIIKIKKLLILTFFGLVLMIVFSDFIFSIWVGDLVKIPSELTITFGIFTFVLISSSCYSSFLNGIGKLRIQVINIIIGAVLFLPLTFFLCERFGVVGLIYAQILVNLSGLVLNIIQFNFVVNKKAKGIWNE